MGRGKASIEPFATARTFVHACPVSSRISSINPYIKKLSRFSTNFAILTHRMDQEELPRTFATAVVVVVIEPAD